MVPHQKDGIFNGVKSQGLREEILAWQGSIKKTGVASDWMVVVVEAPDSKKVNKFPLRTTVLEKLKQEVNHQSP